VSKCSVTEVAKKRAHEQAYYIITDGQGAEVATVWRVSHKDDTTPEQAMAAAKRRAHAIAKLIDQDIAEHGNV
jgi:hypothetical protein